MEIHDNYTYIPNLETQSELETQSRFTSNRNEVRSTRKSVNKMSLGNIFDQGRDKIDTHEMTVSEK